MCVAVPGVCALGCVKAISMRWQEDRECKSGNKFYRHCLCEDVKFRCLFGARMIIPGWNCYDALSNIQSKRSVRGETRSISHLEKW